MGKIRECGGKIDVIKEKVKLRDRKEWIVDDLTEKERKIEWQIKKKTERHRRRRKKSKSRIYENLD